MKNGPSMYETGRFAVVQPSSGGLRIAEGPIDRPPAPRAAERARVRETQGAGARAADAVAAVRADAASYFGRRTPYLTMA